MDYKKAGVDVEAGDRLVDWLKETQPASFPHQDKLVDGIGGFSALFKADFKNYKDPCLVSCTDGVGTKVKLAVQAHRYREVAQDLVAMCLNDLICCGARPLFFLDYYATGKLDLQAAQEFLSGVREACHQSDCALIGGETAEMPDVYQGRDFDCAGFAVGVVDRGQSLGAHRVQDGNHILALASSGCHSNGYSLLRQVFAQDMEDWIDQLLIPTRLYVQILHKLLSLRPGSIKAVAHITGGGLDNIPRVLPPHTTAQLTKWPIPDIFCEVQRRSGLSWDQMLTTLNCGLGLVLIVDAEQGAFLQAEAQKSGYPCWSIGQVVPRSQNEPGWQLETTTFSTVTVTSDSDSALRGKL